LASDDAQEFTRSVVLLDYGAEQAAVDVDQVVLWMFLQM
jgi:hypothetical protein